MDEEFFVEGAREVGLGGVVEGGAGAFARAGDERELADDEDAAADVADGAVHEAGVVGEDAERDSFFGEPADVVFGVTGGDAEEDQEAAFDGAAHGAVDGDAGGGDALEDEFQKIWIARYLLNLMFCFDILHHVGRTIMLSTETFCGGMTFYCERITRSLRPAGETAGDKNPRGEVSF